MPADRLTLYYSGRDPNANRRRAAKTVSIGCESKFTHRLFGGGHLLRLQLRKDGRSSYRPQGGLARRTLLTKVATSRAAASQPRQDLPIVHDFVISRPSGKLALAGALPVPKRRLGHILVGTYVLSGFLIMPFGFLRATWLAASLVVVIGVMGGYTNITLTTWLQTRTPQRMLGRVMSLLMIASIGLSPFSNAVSGALIKLSLDWVFVGAGAMMTVLAVVAGLRREIAGMEMA